MFYKVDYFRTENSEPIKEFLLSLEKSNYGKCLNVIDLLERYGLSVGRRYVKKITKDLFELRIKGKVEVRFLFAYKNNIFYLLHGFKKKRQKLLRKDIKTAENRLTNI